MWARARVSRHSPENLPPAMKFFLMEPNFKKGSFLKQIIRLCELNGIEVIRERIESTFQAASI
jgi:16S rRNA G527 N7-methylase RsmG